MADPSPAGVSLITSIASLLSAIAWPAVIMWFLCRHRAAIDFLLNVFGRKLSTANKLKVGQFEIEEITKEAVKQAGAEVVDGALSRSIPESQIEAAENLKDKVQSAGVDGSQVLETVRRELYDLAGQYESKRLESRGSKRTRKMNEIAAGMRSLGNLCTSRASALCFD